ncbi:TetR/AcrR family transcriptional regulator (plasmid) [Tistrella mobilis]|jgi:AcrR family transcriptional regulator|uniref:TetR/AcrR family transcriptional regulator n=1 Tax=Tistrella mobilis TaxID=171437 RepID=UPI0035584D43
MARTAKAGTNGTPEAPETQTTDAPRDMRKALVEKQIMEQACILFARKGFDGTTLTDVADAVGLTRAAVYYYFRNKEALLEAIVVEATAAPLAESAAWRETAPEDPVERLRSFVEMRVRGVLARQLKMRMIQVTEAVLPPDMAERHTEARRRVLAEYRAILREGMEAGAFRAQDERVAALAIIGMVNWTVNWFSPGRGAELAAVARQIADMAVQSVISPRSERNRLSDPKTALAALRDDVEQLALLLATDQKA